MFMSPKIGDLLKVVNLSDVKGRPMTQMIPTIDPEILGTTTIRAKLTSQYVRDLPVTGRTYFVWHHDLPSFGVRVSKTGVKTYVVQRRVKGVRHPRRQSIERCDLIGAKEALARG